MKRIKQITIDTKSGFCFGVIKAIEIAEKVLQEEKHLDCLGELVHNDPEMQRLKQQGLHVVQKGEKLQAQNKKLMIRAHGEPPETYKKAKENDLKVIDATCPIVLKLQKRIRKAWQEIEDKNGQIVIFGKPEHPEVIGLLGQVKHAILISKKEDIQKIKPEFAVRMFSQTTQNTEDYLHLQKLVKEKLIEKGNADFIAYNTICGQVSNRIPHLKNFSKKFDVIIFVGGKQSSNAKYLFSICKQNNENSYFVSSAEEIQSKWFQQKDNVGVCGATSTPKWLMEKVAERIETCI